MRQISLILIFQILLLFGRVDSKFRFRPKRKMKPLAGTYGGSRYKIIDFTNTGFNGTYTPVSALLNSEGPDCSCHVAAPIWFTGDHAPLDDEFSIHFRGPLKLHKFAHYVSPYFVFGDPYSEDWERLSYYDAKSQTAENVTFMLKGGANSPCLGKALTYASASGKGPSSSPVPLADGVLLNSDEEYSLFSGVPCGASGLGNDCGVYRDGIPAYHGFAAGTRMFLFQFEMPTETLPKTNNYTYYDLPAIWLLNANIPRTGQYPYHPNCSCWSSGCGEFDVFESMNLTEANHLYPAIHTYQGIGDIGRGIQPPAFIQRDPNAVMNGGIIFDSERGIRVFITKSSDHYYDILPVEVLDEMMEDISPRDIFHIELPVVDVNLPEDEEEEGREDPPSDETPEDDEEEDNPDDEYPDDDDYEDEFPDEDEDEDQDQDEDEDEDNEKDEDECEDDDDDDNPDDDDEDGNPDEKECTKKKSAYGANSTESLSVSKRAKAAGKSKQVVRRVRNHRLKRDNTGDQTFMKISEQKFEKVQLSSASRLLLHSTEMLSGSVIVLCASLVYLLT
ncbi:HDL390Cp [Eremothecium sinecaudum]|uniref:glucan endo-1,3-beta-D-glucosidase n=1 Tax=Eremothecium sinecaudum TaxID=45286 RepID=A0A0X8HRW9_9SACH|nr:HDL390Cp [Eremothecium sinecaudum]AMD20354.1 HDL390Cp [Eremothecium sinecaudum]